MKKIYKGSERQKEMLMYGIMRAKGRRDAVSRRHKRYLDFVSASEKYKNR
jgi:hypothetical protein